MARAELLEGRSRFRILGEGSLEPAVRHRSADERLTGEVVSRGKGRAEDVERVVAVANDPLSVGEQVTLIFSGTDGLFDDVATSDMGRFKSELLAYLKTSHPDIEKAITGSGELSEESTQKIRDMVATFKKSLFAASK